jgi:sugar phosphate isomerase/epimerase
MQIGVPTHLFRGPADRVAATVRESGLTCVQLTPSFPGLRFDEPGQFTRQRCREAAAPFLAAGLRIACVTGPTSLLDPDLDRRHRGIVRLHALLRHTHDLGANRVVVQTGSLNPHSPCKAYPPNRSREAWRELQLIVGETLRVAAVAGVLLLLHPGPHHVLASAEDATRLWEELADPLLGFVLDPAALLLDREPATWVADLEALVARLGPRAPVLYAADLGFENGAAVTPRVGHGLLDYGLILRLLSHVQPEATVVLAHLRPEEVRDARAYVERCAAEMM